MESISSVLGTYIIPAHVVPGVLYLYVFNKVCRIGDLPWPGLLREGFAKEKGLEISPGVPA